MKRCSEPDEVSAGPAHESFGGGRRNTHRDSRSVPHAALCNRAWRPATDAGSRVSSDTEQDKDADIPYKDARNHYSALGGRP